MNSNSRTILRVVRAGLTSTSYLEFDACHFTMVVKNFYVWKIYKYFRYFVKKVQVSKGRFKEMKFESSEEHPKKICQVH